MIAPSKADNANWFFTDNLYPSLIYAKIYPLGIMSPTAFLMLYILYDPIIINPYKTKANQNLSVAEKTNNALSPNNDTIEN